MKKYWAIGAVLLLTLTACDKKEDKESNPPESVPAVTTETKSAEETTASTDKKSEETSTTVTEKTEVTTETATEEFTMPEDIPAFEEELDEKVLEAAQLFFDKACEVEQKFSLGTPYSIDTSVYITNEYDWQYYLVTEQGINSIDDVKAEFREVFSKDYDDDIDELFKQKDGRVYSLNGNRGTNIFYAGSEVVEITGRDEGEIRFKVLDKYDETEYGGETYTEEQEFIIVKEDDGKWKVSKFKLPY